MRAISETFFEGSAVLYMPVVALLIFTAVFLTICVRVLRMRKDDVASLAALALEGETLDIDGRQIVAGEKGDLNHGKG